MDELPASMKPVRVGAIAVIRRGAEFLTIERSRYVTAPGRICFPGGRVEAGESEANAVKRELNEELALADATPSFCIWRQATDWNLNLAWWAVDISDSDKPVMNPEEVAAVQWRTSDQLLRDDRLLDTNREFLNACDRGLVHLETPWPSMEFNRLDLSGD